MKTYKEMKKERNIELSYLSDCYESSKSFFESKGIGTKYLHYKTSKYSLEKKKFIEDFFCVDCYCVKFVNGEISELYEYTVETESGRHFGCSVSIEDPLEVIDLYDYIYDSNNNIIGVQKVESAETKGNKTLFGGYPIESLSEEEIKDNIMYLSNCIGYIADCDDNPKKIIETRRINIPVISIPYLRAHNFEDQE